MIEVVVFLLGVILVVSVLADLMNTLINTHTSNHRWWLSRRLSYGTWALMRVAASRVPPGRVREALFGIYPPVLVLLLLVAWVCQQIVGYALIWWAIGGIGGAEGAANLGDSLYYSGVVFFTIGFGEVVPIEVVPRIGAIAEAFSGVSTMALVVGYLPSLYSAFSERERKLMTLDAGTSERMRPTDLVLAWSPDADVDELLSHFGSWEDWVAGVLETHTSFPMLMLFRSHHEGQSWITALGLVCDAALQGEIILGANGRSAYWMLRRSIRLLQEMTEGVDLSEYRRRLESDYEDPAIFDEVYGRLRDHGFEVRPRDEALERTLELRRCYDAQVEYLIDFLMAPKGFWAHEIGQDATQAASITREIHY